MSTTVKKKKSIIYYDYKLTLSYPVIDWMSTDIVESDPLNVRIPLLKVTGCSSKNKIKQTIKLNCLNQNSDFPELSLLLI